MYAWVGNSHQRQGISSMWLSHRATAAGMRSSNHAAAAVSRWPPDNSTNRMCMEKRLHLHTQNIAAVDVA